MDLETAQNNAVAKLPLLKQENGNSFNPVARTTTNANGTSTSTILGPVTTEEKVQKKNDVKARSMLLMALPNEHQFTFNQYKDAKTLFEAIQTRFGGNDATKKTQKTLLKQIHCLLISANLPNGSQLVHEDLEKIQEDDLEEMDLKWQLALLSISARKYYQRTGKKITINGSDVLQNDNAKGKKVSIVHKMGNIFQGKYRGPRNKESRARNQTAQDGLECEEHFFQSMEFQQPEFEGYEFKANKDVCENSSNEIKKTTDALIIKDWVFDCDEDETEVRILKSDNVQHKPKLANQPKKVLELKGYMISEMGKIFQGVSVWEGAEEVQSIIHIKAEKCKNMKHSQDMQLIQKLRDDQKCMKKVFEVMSGRNIVTNSRVTPSWREIVSLTFSEAGVLHVNWISFGHCVLRRDSDKLRHDQKCKNMKHSQDMQLIQKLRDDQKRMKKVFEVMSGRNIVTNSRVTPSWREIVSLTFSEAGVLHVNWTSFGHCVPRRGHLC
ncbi:hypothetical protein Tco_1147039 [Tanacetum coccineum]